MYTMESRCIRVSQVLHLVATIHTILCCGGTMEARCCKRLESWHSAERFDYIVGGFM